MTVKEKLMELLNKPIFPHEQADPIEAVADYLLDNGVTVREQGEWKHGYKNGEYGIWCSKCGTGWPESLNYEVIAACHDFCPNCGAPMKGESNV